MKIVILIIIVLAGGYAFFEQSKTEPNVWVSAVCIVVFMLGLLLLNKKVTYNSFSDPNQKDKEDDHT